MKRLTYLLAFALVCAAGCGDDANNPDPDPDPDPDIDAGPGPDPDPVYIQVERLARPAINEGLFFTEDFLNALNEITPADEVGALVGAVAAEAIAVIDAVDNADGSDDSTATAIVGALIPDVMRIDTTVESAVGTPAYNNAFNAVLSPSAGRKIEDDVIDITLSILLNLDTTGQSLQDNVSYAGSAGNAAAPGHKLLNGQTDRNGSATFPFLAEPN